MKVGSGAAQLGIRRTELFIKFGGIVESIVVFEMEGEWTCLAEILSDEESSETLLEAGLRDLAGSVLRGNLVLNLSKIWLTR